MHESGVIRMRPFATALLALVFAWLAPGVMAQTGDPDRTRQQEALAHAVAIQSAWASVEARIRVTDAANLWEDEWTGLAAPPSGSWWLSSWTERGLTARYCEGVLAVYAAQDELKGLGRGHREVQVAPVLHGGDRTGLHVILANTRIARGAHGRDDTALPACMGIPSTGEDRVGLVGLVADPIRMVTGIRWETETQDVACPGSPADTFREARQVPIQVTALTDCPAVTPECNDLSETAPSAPHLWPRDCALRAGLGSRAACTDWRHAEGLCPFQYAQAAPPTPIPDPVITWRTAPVHRTTGSCSCPAGETGTCTLHYEQNTEYRDFQVRPGAPVVTTRRIARVNGARRLVRTVENCAPPPPPQTCPAGQTGTPPNCTTPPPGQTCPAGQTGTPPNCTTPPPGQTCPAGQTGTPPNCTTPPPGQTCPAGQTGTPPNCTTPPPGQTCPAGQTGTPPNCTTPPPGQTCPAGQTGTPPNCTKPPKDPPRKPDECEDGNCGEGGDGDEGNAEAEADAETAEDDSANEGFGGSSMGPPGSDGTNTGTNDDSSTSDDSSADNGGGEGGGGKPIVLDLDGDGVELVPLEESTAFFDINGDGYRERMAWVSSDDGFLAYDKDGDGRIAAHDELSFVSYVEGARTDLEGLRYFDTDGDGQLDPDDAEWGMFRVWQDLDQDGESDPGELRSLDEAGIESISVTSDGIGRTVAGNTVFGEGEYVGPHGPRAFWDAALRRGERKE